MNERWSGIERRLERLDDCAARLDALGVRPRAAPIARFRNVLAHEYIDVDWNLVYGGFQRLGELRAFASATRAWLRGRPAEGGLAPS